MRTLALALCLAITLSGDIQASLVSQTGSGGAVPDASLSGKTFEVTFSDARSILAAGNNVTVTLVNFKHNFFGDLLVRLEHVSFGGAQTAFDKVFTTSAFIAGEDFDGTYSFNSGASTTLQSVADANTLSDSNPFHVPEGTYQTTASNDVDNSNLSSFWNGQAVAGTWRLFISDNYFSDRTNSDWTWRVDIEVQDVSAVPEPSTFAAWSLLGLASCRRRRMS